MRTVKILGGGIAGLTAAINLKKAGLDVEVHEKKAYCGKHSNDFQFLENWIFKQNVLDALNRLNIGIDFYLKPCHSLELYSPSLRKYVGKSSQPLMYLVKRGQVTGSIDKALETQAKDAGAKIICGSRLRPEQADIIATGPTKPTWIARGVMFRCKHPDTRAVILDNRLSLTAYSYFVANDNIGEITSCNPVGTKDLGIRFAKTVKTFEKLFGVKANKVVEKFSNVVGFRLPRSAFVRNQCFAGEAAGFQDNVAGFGMVYAMKSGCCAARSIIDRVNYDALWKKEFLKQLKVSAKHRAFYERLSNDDFERLIGFLISGNFVATKVMGADFGSTMHKVYNNSLWPFRPLLRTG
jgi:flavin-dependent dehydrogenase